MYFTIHFSGFLVYNPMTLIFFTFQYTGIGNSDVEDAILLFFLRFCNRSNFFVFTNTHEENWTEESRDPAIHSLVARIIIIDVSMNISGFIQEVHPPSVSAEFVPPRRCQAYVVGVGIHVLLRDIIACTMSVCA